jgi:hypothetical protein
MSLTLYADKEARLSLDGFKCLLPHSKLSLLIAKVFLLDKIHHAHFFFLRMSVPSEVL